MNSYAFYETEQVQPLYDYVIPAYQKAFAGWPWNEASKCADDEQSCNSGFSPLPVGHFCRTCGLCTQRPAYEPSELRERFDKLTATRPVSWFIEGNSQGLNLFALAWQATPEQIAEEKYADVPAMREWLVDNLGVDPIIWLDDVFADKEVQERSNLSNFRAMCNGFSEHLGGTALYYRTIAPQMLAAAKRDFAVEPLPNVPDRRSFIEIDLKGES